MTYGKNDVFILGMHAEGVNALGQEGLVDYTIKSEEIVIGQRGFLEGFEGVRQIIPYICFKQGDKIFGYRRTAKGGDARLHGKVSVGFGGHVDMEDVKTIEGHASIIDLEATLKTCAARELEEEITLGESVSVESISVESAKIVSFETEVDRVHIGVPVVINLSGGELASNEDEIEIVGAKTANEWMNGDFDFEVWTHIMLNSEL